MNTVTAGVLPVILGRQGENNATTVRFPLREFADQAAGGTYVLLVRRPGERAMYPAAIAAEGEYVRWVVSASDTALCGEGAAVLRYMTGNTVAKSRAWPTRVLASPDADIADPPEPCQSWVDSVLQAGADAEAAADRAEAAQNRQPVPNAETGTWWRWNSAAEAWEDTGEAYSGGAALPAGGTEGQFLRKNSGADGDADWAGLPTYDGVYEVTPLIGGETTMRTRAAYLDRDIVVKAVPVYKTQNQSGGNTVIIGG